MTPVGVFLDGLQEERVASDPLHRHHQEEAQGGGVDLRPGGVNREHSFKPTEVTCQSLCQGNNSNLRRCLDDSDDLVPKGLLLFVAVLHHRDIVVVGQVFFIGCLNVRGQAEE